MIEENRRRQAVVEKENAAKTARVRAIQDEKRRVKEKREQAMQAAKDAGNSVGAGI